MYLSDMKIGQSGRIAAIQSGDPAYRHRLLAMGLTPGTEFIVSRIAPLGDPIEILIRGFALCLRKMEARVLEIEGVAT